MNRGRDILDAIKVNLVDVRELLVEFEADNLWVELGYASLNECYAVEIAPLLPRLAIEARQGLHKELSDMGKSVREIEAVTGAGKSTVARDIGTPKESVPDGTDSCEPASDPRSSDLRAMKREVNELVDASLAILAAINTIKKHMHIRDDWYERNIDRPVRAHCATLRLNITEMEQT